MEYHPLDVTDISAKDLKDVNLISKMKVYVVVSIAEDDPATKRKTRVDIDKRKTRVDKDGGKSPKWNDCLSFTVDAATLARNPSLKLVFRLRSKRLLWDRDIGEVSVEIKKLLDSAPERMVKEYPVHTPSGNKGTLKFSYKFGDKVVAYAGASTVYYPPLPQYDGYAQPQPTYINAAPPQQGYGYPQQQEDFGLGLGAGLLGGLLVGGIGCG